MATFNARSFEKKLKSLDGTQTGIQTLSLWIIHHRQHAKAITSIWFDQLGKVQRPERRLGIFYLANDVVQNGRRKAKELVMLFGEVFKKAAFLLNDAKIKSQVERTFNIWLERSLYDKELIEVLKGNLESHLPHKQRGGETEAKKKEMKNLAQSPVKSQPAKSQPVKPQSAKSQPVQPQPVQPQAAKSQLAKSPKLVPPDFKVSNLLVSVKKNTSLDNDIERKSKALDSLKIDASSYDSVKHIKDRSSVGKFFKQFEESKVILDDYIHALRKSEKDKRHLLTLLDGGEAFYDLAQKEAKVIVNAYQTFGNRLNSMKKKLDCRIKKMTSDRSPTSSVTMTTKEKRSSQEDSHIEDMELDSDSDYEVPTSQQYNPNTAPSHDEFDNIPHNMATESNAVQNSNAKQFFNPNAMNGMTSFLDTHSISAAFRNSASNVSTPMSAESSVGTPDGLIIADGNISQVNHSQNSTVNDQSSSQQSTDQNRPLQNLIDTLFPVLSKSLQTIKEKQQAAGEESKPSVNDAIAFALALGDGENREEIPRKKNRFSNDSLQPTSPVSLTNPKGLSENQTELISIAAGLTKFDENFLPVPQNSIQTTDQPMKINQEEESKSKSDDHDKRRDDRKSRHGSGRHRTSFKDDERHKRSSSRSPRRSSHRSRDDRHSERRRSRRSQSPKRRRGSRGRRSSSRDRDGVKRGHSPDANMAPYYNDRRSPTPELDSSSHNPPPGQYTQVGNPMLQNANFQTTNTTNDMVTVQEMEQTADHQDVLQVNENITNAASGVSGDTQDPNAMLHLPPLHMNTMLGPVLTSFPNPLHLLQQQQQPDQQILHLRPIGPGIIPFNQSQNMMPNNQLTNQNLNSMNAMETNINNNLGEAQGMNPLQALSQQNMAEQEDVNSFHGPFDPSFTSMEGPNDFPPPPPPEFPGPPPRPPSFRPIRMDMMRGEFRPMFRPKFAEPDPLLDQLEAQHLFEPPLFNRPRFRPRFDRPPDVRFRPRFGPVFPGPIL